MEIITASVIFLVIGFFIGVFLTKLRTQSLTQIVPQLEERVRLLDEQKSNLETQVRSQDSMLQLLEPLRQQVAQLQEVARLTKEEQIRDAERIRQQLSTLNQVNEEVRINTQQLSTALTQNTERGRWGEVQLEQILQASGLIPGVNFVMRKSVLVNGKELKPDCVVRFPDGANIVIDSKVPFDKFDLALSASDEASRKRYLKEHADSVLKHAKDLTGKNYHAISNGLEFVILFMPFDSLLSAAIEGNNSIISELEKIKIIPATPTSLIGLMNMVHYAWRRNSLAESTAEISRLASEHLNNLNSMIDALKKLGNNLGTSVNAFNDLASRFDNSVLRSARNLRELGVSVDQEITQGLERVEKTLRDIEAQAPEVEIKEIESEPEG